MYGETNLLALAAAVLLLATSSLAQMTLNPSASAPSGASPTVNPAFAAFAFEERSFFSYSSKLRSSFGPLKQTRRGQDVIFRRRNTSIEKYAHVDGSWECSEKVNQKDKRHYASARSEQYKGGADGLPYIDFTLSQNLMAQSASRTNSRPAVRVGGNSLNTATYVTDSSTSIIIPASQQNRSIPNSVTLGPAFWSCFKNFPDAQYIVGM